MAHAGFHSGEAWDNAFTSRLQAEKGYLTPQTLVMHREPCILQTPKWTPATWSSTTLLDPFLQGQDSKLESGTRQYGSMGVYSVSC